MQRRLTWLVGFVITIAMGLGLVSCAGPASSGVASSGSGESPSHEAGSAVSGCTGTPIDDSIGVAINLSDNSILVFDGSEASAQLVSDMREGKTPKSCTVRYDQMGAGPTVTVTDGRTMREVYSKLARMHVEGVTNMSITDSYHLVSFELQDGTKVSFNFEGEGILVRNTQNYAVSDQGDLWTYVRYLQDRELQEKSAGDDSLPITLKDDDELVQRCPTWARAGDTVQLSVMSVTDANAHVSVNGDEHYGKFVYADMYEFVMPDAPVTVRAWTSSDGLPGA